MRQTALSIPLLALLAGACTAAGTQANNQAAGNQAMGNVAASASSAVMTNGTQPTDAVPQNSTAGGAGPLAVYAGRLPFDEVNGVAFPNHPLVRRAVEAAVPDAEVRRSVLSTNIVASEILLRNGRLIANGCEPHNCGPHHWTITIDPAGASAEVCYIYEEAGPQSRIFAAGQPMRRGGEMCERGD